MAPLVPVRVPLASAGRSPVPAHPLVSLVFAGAVVISVLDSYVDRERMRALPPGGHLMLDSGAYSAMTRGVELTLDGLTTWYRSVPAERYAALDVIYDPEQSRANAIEQRAAGVDVIPAVHSGTSPDEVERLAAEGFRQVALGGLVRKHQSHREMFAWMHACLDRADACGMPVHGYAFAPLSPRMLPLLLRFASVDASSWTGRWGDCYVWNGHRLVQLETDRDRLDIARLTRRLGVPELHTKLAAPIGSADGSHIALYALNAASFLAFGEWLMARGGPRLYLAAYHNTTSRYDRPGSYERGKHLDALTVRMVAAMMQGGKP